jgi:DNA primase
MDFIMVFQSGIQNVVASLGTALTVEQIRLLRRYTDQVVMLFDADTAGELAVLRSLDILLEEGMHVRIAALEKNEDPDSFIRKFGVESFKKRISQAQSLFDYKLNTLLGSMDGKTIEGKAKIAQEMLATLQRFPNAVIQREYLRKLANTLHVSEQALHIELQKLSSSSKPVKMNASMDKEMEAAQNKAKTAERSILRLMLEEDEFIPLTKGEVSLSDFQDEHIKQVITRIFELFDSGTKVSPHNLLSLFDDHRILQLISSLLVAEDASIGDKRKIFQDCIQRIKEDRLRCQRQSLHQQIKVAESAGDRLKLEELKMQFNKLIQEVRNA